MPSIIPQRRLVGCAGEHFVAYRLSAMGYLVALTRGGAPSVDLMVSTPDGQKTVTMQVKTANKAFLKCKKRPKDNCWYWRVSRKARDLAGKSVFYAFVDLKEGKEHPDVFIVPADFVGRHLNTYPKGSPKPTSFWFDIMEEDKDKWHEAWHLIKEHLTLPTR